MRYLLLIFFPIYCLGQGIHVHRNSDLHWFLESQEIKGNFPIHSSLNDYSSARLGSLSFENEYNDLDIRMIRKLIRSFPEKFDFQQNFKQREKVFTDSTQTFYSIESEQKIDPIFNDFELDRKPVLKYFYKNPNYFFLIRKEQFLLNINPILNFTVGRDISDNTYPFANQRGIAFSGHINNKIFYYSDILESQAAFPTYIVDFIDNYKAIPGNGLYKSYNSIILGKNAGYDFLNAHAYINANLTRNINVEFGNGRQFIGNGNRSLLLSDFSNNRLYLKFNTNIWKINYQNIFNELIPVSVVETRGDTLIDRKYTATHFLNFKHNNIELGIFETVVFQRGNGFDLQYLNPVILYRLVEHNLNSSDNVLVGANAKWNLLHRFQIYGQIVLDEFNFNLLLKNEGWWGNKYGLQLGAKYVDAFGVNGLFLQGEYNKVRPFTYSHKEFANYSHANQALAHPLGANFQEFHLQVRYELSKRIHLISKNFFIQQGSDTSDSYIGSNILTSNSERSGEKGHRFLQGNRSATFLSDSRISYEFFPNYYLDFNLQYRAQSFVDTSFGKRNNVVFSTGVRMNFWNQNSHF